MSRLLRKRNNHQEVPSRRSMSPVGQTDSSHPADSRYVFRRNRTITGSSSQQIASTNELHAHIRSPRANVHHLARARRRLLSYLGGVVAAAFMLYLLVSQLVATETVQVSTGSELHASQMKPYQQAAESYFASRPLERLRFMINQQDFLNHMQAVNPEVKLLHTDAGSGLGEMLITITPRQPIARWSASGSRDYVDEAGIVFQRNYFETPSVEIRDNSGIQTEGSQAVTSQRFLGFVGRVIGLMKNDGYTVKTVTLPTLTTKQIRITIAGTTPYFTLSVDRPPAGQVEDIIRIQRYLRTKGITPKYVDVRVQGKAFYR